MKKRHQKNITDVRIFQNPQFGQIRISLDESNEPLFCLADLCKALNLTNNRKVKKQLDDDVTFSYPLIDNLGREQMATFVSEPGMYTVILRSNSPNAKPMQKWVTSEVLPSIRKTGGYMTARTDETPEDIMARALIVAQETINRTKQELSHLQEENILHKQQLELAQPKVQYYNDVLQSESVYTINRVAKEFGMSGVALNRKLQEMGIQYNQGGQWLLNFKYQSKGYTKTRTYAYMRSDGSTGTSLQTVWTEKGREFIHKILNN